MLENFFLLMTWKQLQIERIVYVEDIMSQALALDHVTLLEENGCLLFQTKLDSHRLVESNEAFSISDYLNTD